VKAISSNNQKVSNRNRDVTVAAKRYARRPVTVDVGVVAENAGDNRGVAEAMRAKTVTGICVVLMTMAVGTLSVSAAGKEAPRVALTGTGQRLEVRYAGQLEAVKAEIVKAVPAVDEQKKATYLKAREAEKAAKAALGVAEKDLGRVARGRGLVAHAKGKWIGGAEKGIAAAQAKLKAAITDAEREAARGELAKWQKNKEDGLRALEERQAALDEALAEEPALIKNVEAAKEKLANAKANTLNVLKELGLDTLLTSDKLDGKLAKFVVLTEATPRGLAEYAQQGNEQERLVDWLLADADLMRRMAVADGARDGKYGQAMKIYADIQEASKKAASGVLQRLALGIGLEHAVPHKQRNATVLTDAPEAVDPVKRYLNYEKAFLAGELDPAFKDLAAWDLRMVVNGEEPDEIAAWGRKMLRNYRPDHVSTSDYRWRYVAAVRTDIRYGSQYNKYDKPELQFFQNILMNGGVCGRRAFFGRFILRAFGIPTTARPQRGHAALTHWTPDGWVICLGGGWGAGWVMGRNKDLDFLAITQARENRKAYLQVKRARWVGDVMGEKRTFGFLSGDPAFWNGVSLYRQQAIIEEAKAVALAAVGEELGEANESKVKYAVEAATVTEADRKIVVDKGGAITIPAAACSKPTKSTGKIVFMPSNLGGKQLHYSRTGNPEEFEYALDAPKAGKYKLSARVVVPSWDQLLLVAVNGAEKPVDIALPLTVGMWDKTEPVELALTKGENVLTFSRGGDNIRGLTIRDFTLTPVGK